VRHYNSVFHDLLKRVAWGRFDRLVDEHGADKHVRRLSTKTQFIALLYGELSGALSCARLSAVGKAMQRGFITSVRGRVALDAVRCQCARNIRVLLNENRHSCH
jgi:hypothetical protein